MNRYTLFTVDLSIAHPTGYADILDGDSLGGHEVTAPGRRIYFRIVEGDFSIKLYEETQHVIPYKAGDRTPILLEDGDPSFDRFYILNPAQAGKKLAGIVTYGPERPGEMVKDPPL